ncbi:MAG: aspartate-semialdehyde dehydrogenase [Acidobacteriota bacterium]
MTEAQTLSRPSTSSAQEKIPVAVLGATGSVGQRFVQLLEEHPWFRLHEVVASDRSSGRPYGEAAAWRLNTPMHGGAAALSVKSLGAELESALIFSALDSSVAGEAEEDYANRGAAVVSNSKNHRMDADVPLLIPEINPEHLGAIEAQKRRRGGAGFIVTNPNCSTVGLTMAIAPIDRLLGISALHVTTMQAISGAGYSGVSSYAILDNVVPFIGDEEKKIESEPQRILGNWTGQHFQDAVFTISAQANRVAVIDGHLMTISLSVGERSKAQLGSAGKDLVDEVRSAIAAFRGEPQRLGLPSAPSQPVHVMEEPDRPQPRLDRELEKGMAVSVGRIRPCPILDLRMVALVHNTIRGAAGAALLNAELLKAMDLLP